MTRIIFGIVFCMIMVGIQSCKKNNNNTENQSNAENNTHQISPEASVNNPQEEVMLKDAQSRPLTNLALSENTFDFGNIKKGESVEHQYQVTNTGKNPLIIFAVKPSCGCTAPNYTKDPIMPGKTGTITLKFDSSGFEGNIHKQANVYANVEKTPIVISFTGNVVP